MNVSLSAVIDSSAETVWQTVSDFQGIDKYLAMVTESTMVGSGVGAVRTLTLEGGAQVVERLEKLDGRLRSLTYAIIDSPLPIKDYVSTMDLQDLGGDRCLVMWASKFEPSGATEAEAKELIEGIYKAGFDGLKKIHGG